MSYMVFFLMHKPPCCAYKELRPKERHGSFAAHGVFLFLFFLLFVFIRINCVIVLLLFYFILILSCIIQAEASIIYSY